MEEALQYSQLITNIVIIILFLGLAILVLRLIKSIKNISARVEKLSSDVMEVKPKVEKLIDKVNGVTENVNSIVVKVNENIHVLTTVVDKFKVTADNILDFEQKIQKKIEPSVLDTVNTISAVSVGIRTFFDKLKRNRKPTYRNDDDELSEYLEERAVEINKELEDVNEKLSNLQK